MKQYFLTGCALALASAGLAQAQTFPAKPIRVVVPFAAGSATDTVARTYAQALTRSDKAWWSTTAPAPTA